MKEKKKRKGVSVSNSKKLFYTVANPARGLLEGKENKKQKNAQQVENDYIVKFDFTVDVGWNG